MGLHTQHMLYFLLGLYLKITNIWFDFQNIDLCVCLRQKKLRFFSFFKKKNYVKIDNTPSWFVDGNRQLACLGTKTYFGFLKFAFVFTKWAFKVWIIGFLHKLSAIVHVCQDIFASGQFIKKMKYVISDLVMICFQTKN